MLLIGISEAKTIAMTSNWGVRKKDVACMEHGERNVSFSFSFSSLSLLVHCDCSFGN